MVAVAAIVVVVVVVVPEGWGYWREAMVNVGNPCWRLESRGPKMVGSSVHGELKKVEWGWWGRIEWEVRK